MEEGRKEERWRDSEQEGALECCLAHTRDSMIFVKCMTCCGAWGRSLSFLDLCTTFLLSGGGLGLAGSGAPAGGRQAPLLRVKQGKDMLARHEALLHVPQLQIVHGQHIFLLFLLWVEPWVRVALFSATSHSLRALHTREHL